MQDNEAIAIRNVFSRYGIAIKENIASERNDERWMLKRP